MYNKISVDRYHASVVSMEKMNVSSNKKKDQATQSNYSSEEKEKKYYYNQLRKRREIISLIKMNFKEGDSCFITLTFTDDSISLSQASIQFEKFIKQMRRIYQDLRYVLTIEYQKRGVVHYHLICNIIDEQDATYSVARCWNNGSIDVKKIYDIKDIACYVTKDFLKQDKNSPLFGKRCYKTSQQLDKPLVIKSWREGMDFETIKNSIISGSPEKEVNLISNKAGKVSYELFTLNSDCDSLFGDYVFAEKRE